MVPRFRNLFAVLCALSFAACGGDDTSGPETPAAVADVTVTPASLELDAGDTTTLQATLQDADGQVLTGRTITWSSSDESVATVGSTTGLVTAVAEGDATITATSEGESGSALATISWADFAPEETTTISGDQTFASVDIPEGVSVTVASDAVVTSEGAVSIAGEIAGDCTELDLRSGGALTVSGTIDTRCSSTPEESAPGLRLVSGGALTLDSAGIAASGDVEITNDTTLTDADFEGLMRVGSPVTAAAAAGKCHVSIWDLLGVDHRTRDGLDGDEVGGAGTDGKDWKLVCNGDLEVAGTRINTPDAGHGGTADNSNPSDPNSEARGGDGGDGGRLRMASTGNINFKAGAGNRIALAHGGNGGDAVMTAQVPGGGATATGGDGGDSGTLLVQALGTITIEKNGLEIIVGRGGHGGAAKATAADGEDAGADAAQPGGTATAKGGAAGSTPDAQLRARGSVVGTHNIKMTGGNGGNGGKATAIAGNGGDGNQAHPDGAAGGAIAAQGGDGGDALAKDLNGFLVGDGGGAGDAEFMKGKGGVAFDGCSVTPAVPGGNGGKGGDGDGGPGSPGSGLNDGSGGTAVVHPETGDGGNGGDGDGPGTGGLGGNDGITIGPAGKRDDQGGKAFQDGEDGTACANFTVDTSKLPSDFTHQVGVTPCPQDVGTIVITNTSNSAGIEYVVTTSQPLEFHNAGQSFTGSLAPGKSVTITVGFDCSQTSSFTGEVKVQINTPQGSHTETHTVKGNVN